MKILFNTVNSLRYYGGAEKWAISTINGLTEHGHSVEAVYLSFVPNGIERVSDEYIRSVLRSPYNEVRFRRGKFTPLQMDDPPNYDKYDVVYTMAGYYGFLKQIIEHASIKKIFGLHDPALQNPKLNRLQRMIIDKLVPKFDVVHLQDQSQKNIFKNVDNRFRVLQTWYYGPYPDLKTSHSFDRFTIVFAGRHETDKGFDTLMQIAKKIPDNVDLIILGTGTRTEELQNLNNNVKNLGFVSDFELSDILKKSHVMLYPSYSESTTSMTLNDGLINGLPILFRPIPQNTDLLNYPECKKCEKTEDFLDSIINLRDKWESDPNEYLELRISLQNRLKNKGDYVQAFIDTILKA